MRLEDTPRRSIFFSLPTTIGAFFREVLAVTILLVLTQRAIGYDFFTPSLVLLLIFFTFRVPYVNSYTLLFEAFSIGSWDIKNHVGLRKYDDISQNLLHVIVIFIAHVLGALAAAACRVYFDVMYGTELMFGNEPVGGPNTHLAPALTVDVDKLRQIDSFWGGSSRLNRLQGINGTLTSLIPIEPNNDLGIGSTALTVWYTVEEIGYVFMLCVCYIHIWLSTGVGENRKAPLNPFAQAYWRNLFKLCLLVTLLYTALYRAFPTAHGSLHVTIFKVQYQAWNPTIRILDEENSETFARIFGGFLGLFLAVAYNKILVGTERQTVDDEGDFYYKLVWGLEPDPDHTRARRTQGYDDGGNSSDEERGDSRVRKSAQSRWASSASLRSVSVAHAGRHCMDPLCTVCGLSRKPPDVKLRIPRTLDHPK